jgi:quercetin dioxygenase-like cupin family protein
MLKKLVLCAALVGLGLGGTFYAQAQAPTIKRTVLQKADVPDGKKYEVVFGLAELPAGIAIGKHTHFGIELGTVVSGEVTLMVDGQPDKTYKPGDSWQIPTGTAHDAKAGADGAKVIVSYTVEKGQPLATPAK